MEIAFKVVFFALVVVFIAQIVLAINCADKIERNKRKK